MKRFLVVLMVLSAGTGMVQAQKEQQSGVPARLVAINGKAARSFLQSVEGRKLTFQPYKSTKNIRVDISRVSYLEFYLKYDSAAVDAAFVGGEYDSVLSMLEPIIEPLFEFMVVSNNLQKAQLQMMTSYLNTGQLEQAAKVADILEKVQDPRLALKGTVCKALVAIAQDDLAAAEEIRSEMDDGAAGLYVQASIERARKKPKVAIQIVADIIANHGNDMEWLPASELLSAHLYLDLMMTNSAALTARQVKNMYAGTSISADAETLCAGLMADPEESE